MKVTKCVLRMELQEGHAFRRLSCACRAACGIGCVPWEALIDTFRGPHQNGDAPKSEQCLWEAKK